MSVGLRRIAPYLSAIIAGVLFALVLPDGRESALSRVVPTAIVGSIFVAIVVFAVAARASDGSGAHALMRLPGILHPLATLQRWRSRRRWERNLRKSSDLLSGRDLRVERFPYAGSRAPRLVAHRETHLACLRAPLPGQVLRNVDAEMEVQLKRIKPLFINAEFAHGPSLDSKPLADLSNLH